MNRPYRLTPEDLPFVEQMANTHLASRSASQEISAMNGCIWLDDSLQGWKPETLAKAASDGRLSIGEDFEDAVGQQLPPNGIQGTRNWIILGCYRHHPREIVLFPKAIELVAGLPEFQKAGIDSKLLFKSVLFHEIGHWLTLVPGLHPSRIQRVRQSCPSEEAESLTELLNWLALSYAAEAGNADARRLLQCQFYKRNRGPVWQYQVYPFWLVASGLVTSHMQLEGREPATLGTEACKLLESWLLGDGEYPASSPTARYLMNSVFPNPESIGHLLPGLGKPPSMVTARIGELMMKWSSLLKIPLIQPGEDDPLDVLDI